MKVAEISYIIEQEDWDDLIKNDLYDILTQIIMKQKNIYYVEDEDYIIDYLYNNYNLILEDCVGECITIEDNTIGYIFIDDIYEGFRNTFISEVYHGLYKELSTSLCVFEYSKYKEYFNPTETSFSDYVLDNELYMGKIIFENDDRIIALDSVSPFKPFG